VVVTGKAHGRTIVFAHGSGCDQSMWRLVAPAFAEDHQLVLFDHVGAGGSDLTARQPERYASLDGYADDILQICTQLDLHDVVLVGHSVSAMIGAHAATREPSRFDSLVLVGPSPRYIDEGDPLSSLMEDSAEELYDNAPCGYLSTLWVRRPFLPLTAQLLLK
jgi:sigma-B regulation protein RsbQ